jgi:hypothetical protein
MRPRWWVARIGADFDKPKANVYRPDRHRRKARRVKPHLEEQILTA